MNKILSIILSCFPIFILGWLGLDALLSPKIEWAWGYYNYEMIVTLGFGLLYISLMSWWNTIQIRKEIDKIKEAEE